MDCCEVVDLVGPNLLYECTDLPEIADVDNRFTLPFHAVGNNPASSYPEDRIALCLEKTVQESPVLTGYSYDDCTPHLLDPFQPLDNLYFREGKDELPAILQELGLPLDEFLLEMPR